MSVGGSWKPDVENMLCVPTVDLKTQRRPFIQSGFCPGSSAALSGAAPRVPSPRRSGLKSLAAQEVTLCLGTFKEFFAVV